MSLATEPGTERAPQRRRGLARPTRRSLPLLVLLAGVVTQGVLLVQFSRGMWFWADDWDFLFNRGTVPGTDLGLFAPHNGHWSTGPVIVVRVLFEVFGMKSYLPYAMVTILIHLAITVTTYLLIARAGVNRWIAVATAWIVLFIGTGADNMLWDATMNNTGAILLGLLALLVCQGDELSSRRTAAVVGLLVAALACSGTGLSSVVMVAIFVAVQHSPAAALRVGGIPLGAFAAWYLVYGRDGGDSIWAEQSQYFDLPLFIWTGLTKSIGNSIGIVEAGPVIFLLVLGTLLIWRDAPLQLRVLAWSGLSAAAAQLTLEAFTRIALGPEIAASGRYAYFTIVLLGPAFGLTLLAIARLVTEPRWLAGAFAAGALGTYAIHGVGATQDFADFHRAISAPWEDRILGTVQTVDLGQKVLTTEYGSYDVINGFIAPDLVASPEVRRALPEREPSTQGRLDAEMLFDVGVGSETYDLFAPVDVQLAYGWDTPIEPGPGCAEYHANKDNPMLFFETGEGNELGITTDATRVTTVLQRGDELSGPRDWPVTGGSVHVATSAKDAILRVAFDRGGTYTICKQ